MSKDIKDKTIKKEVVKKKAVKDKVIKTNSPKSIDYWLEEKNLSKLEEWYGLGISKQDIANNMGVSRSTLWKWEKESVHISNALHAGQIVKTEKVVNALFKRAIGYDHVDIEYRYDENGNEYPYRKFRKHYPGEPSLIKYYANNTDPKNWKDKVDYSDTTAHEKLDELRNLMKANAKE